MTGERFICAGEPQFGDAIFYNLVQHLIAGAVSAISERFGGPTDGRQELTGSARSCPS